MALQAAVPLAGKLLPYLIKAGSAANLPMLLRTAGVVGGAAPGLMRGDLGSAFTGGALGGLFCDVRVKEDIAPLQNSEVNDLLSECAFFVKDLNECSW